MLQLYGELVDEKLKIKQAAFKLLCRNARMISQKNCGLCCFIVDQAEKY